MPDFMPPQRDPLFFMHIPKTAGMSMRSYLADQYAAAAVCPANTWSEIAGLDRPIGSYRLVQGHFRYNLRAALGPATRVIAVVRDPLSRTMSTLAHLRRDPAFHPDHALARGLSVREMLRKPVIMQRQRNVQTAYFSASASPDSVLSLLRTTPKADVIDLEDEPSLDLAISQASAIEFLGSTNDIPLLLRQLSQQHGLHPIIKLPLVNNSPDGLLAPASLDEEDLDLLKSYNNLDLPFYYKCLDMIEQREIIRQMRALVERGVYVRLESSFDIDLGDAIPGSGWYSPEREDGRTWRWTGPEARFTLELPLKASGRYVISIRFAGRSIESDGIKIEANGRLLHAVLSGGEGSYELSAELPPEVLSDNAGCCRLVFDVGSITRPSGGDLRPLGIAVSKIHVERRD